jgi:GNAT superfamily N-acetyltransferase
MVSLRPMTEDEFQAFLSDDIHAYADEKVKSGNWTSGEAMERSRQEHNELLPDGLATAHQHLFTIESEGTPVGRLWLCSDPQTTGGAAFIYDVFVEEPYRRQGIATQAMLLAEREAVRLGCRALALHVFGHNTAARSLYEKLGYQVTNVSMAKSLTPSNFA